MNLKFRPYLIFLLLAATGTALLILPIAAGKDVLTRVTLQFSYPIMIGLFVLWGIALIRLVRRLSDKREMLRSATPGIICCLLLTLCISLSTDIKFRVLADEANLVSVSKSMADTHTVHLTTQGRYYYDNFNPTVSYLGKRPYLFPFGVHILHLLTGYRVENVFAFNIMILFGLLLSVFIFFQKRYGILGACIAVILIAAQPIVPACAMSGGFDLLSCFLFIIAMLCLKKALDTPDDHFWMYLTAMQFLLLAHSRYESILYFAVTFFILVVMKKFTLQHIKQHPISLGLIPLLISPLVWQRLGKGDSFEQPAGVEAFSVNNIFQNTFEFLKSVTDFKLYLPYSDAVCILGIAGGVFLLWSCIRRSENNLTRRAFLFIVAVNLISVWIVFTSYYWGNARYPYSARFFLLPSVILALSAAFILLEILKSRKIRPVYGLVIAAVLFIIYYPVSMQDRFFNTQLSLRQYSFMEQALADYGQQNLLVVSDRPVYTAIHNVGSINFKEAEKQSSKIMRELSRHLFKDVLVVQHVKYSTQKPRSNQTLRNVPLKTLDELQVSASEYLRLSKVESGEK